MKKYLAISYCMFLTFWPLQGVSSAMAEDNKRDQDQRSEKVSSLITGYYHYEETENIQFKSGHPLEGESLNDALVDPKDENEKLKRNLKLINHFVTKSSYHVEVIGFTDDKECTGSECYDLAARRALSVYEWLIEQGVSKKNTELPVSCGRALRIASNDVEEGRSRNRRVELGYLFDDRLPSYLSESQCKVVPP